jgi:hypothetical protein
MDPAPAAGPPHTAAWRALRHDPRHAPELAVLNAVPLISPGVVRWRADQTTNGTAEQLDRLAHRTLRQFVGRARAAGVVTGSSFYVGMVPAVAMIYFEQLLLTLRIAAIYGRDPELPTRAAELLMLQRRYETVLQAEEALRIAGHPGPKDRNMSRTRRMLTAIGQLPSMIGLQLRRIRGPMDLVIAGAEVAGFFVPFLSIPVWAYATGVSTRRLGQAAIAYYRQVPPSADPAVIVTLPAPPTATMRRRLAAFVVLLIVALGVVAPFVPLGRSSHFLPLGGIVLAELALVLSGLRLLFITRPVSLDRGDD